MSSKLSSTNVYMRDPVVRRTTVLRSVVTSSAIEGIRAPFTHAAALRAPKTVSTAAKVRRSIKC